MRLHIETSPAREIIPYAHLPRLVGTIHKWIGPDNKYHDDLSLYGFSWLRGGKDAAKKGLDFPDGASFHISAQDSGILLQMYQNILREPALFGGLEVQAIDIEQTPAFTKTSQVFFADSPIFTRRQHNYRPGNRTPKLCYTYQDTETDAILTENFQRKLTAAGIAPEGASVRFLRDYPIYKRTKPFQYNQNHMIASICPVEVTGTPQQLALAWNVGVGQCTGIGMGALRIPSLSAL